MDALQIENARDFGRAVRSARKEAGLSQMQLAELCNCSQRFVSEVERGKATAELGRALKLFAALRIPVTAGTIRTNMNGRVEVQHAIARIESKLNEDPRPKRSLSNYL